MDDIQIFINKTLLNNGKLWPCLRIKIDPESKTFSRAQKQAKDKSQHTMAYAQDASRRSPEMKFNAQLMGILAEMACEAYLTKILDRNIKEKWKVLRYDDIRTDGFKSSANEFDLKITNANQSYFIESRSSIVHDREFSKGLQNFDVIGPYASAKKGNEVLTDIYLRPLYRFLPYKTKKFSKLKFQEDYQKRNIELYLVAGCFKADFLKHGTLKNMHQNTTQYHVVKIMQAYDPIAFEQKLVTHLMSQNSSIAGL